MPAYAPRTRQAVSPKALVTVVGVHAVGLAILLTLKPELVLPADLGPIIVENVPIDPPPPVAPPPPSPKTLAPAPVSVLTNPQPIQPVPPIGSVNSGPTTIVAPPVTPYVGVGTIVAPDPGPSLVESLSTEASLLTPPDRARPPYPPSKVRMGDEAVLPLKLTIGADGRVKKVEPVGKVDRVFFNAAEKHILKMWRYAPAMKGDERVESVKTIRLRFELEG